MIELSASSLNLYLECPRCFWLYVNKKIKRPEKPVATITTGLDRVIKEYFNLFRQKGILPTFIEGKVPGKLITNLPRRGWLEFIDKDIDAKLVGYLDECLDLGNNFYAPLDHKSRGTKPDQTHPAHQFQMDVYTFLLEQNNFPTKNLAYLIYYIPTKINTGKNIEFEIIVSEVKTNPKYAKQVFMQAVSVLKDPIPTLNKSCPFCEWIKTHQIR